MAAAMYGEREIPADGGWHNFDQPGETGRKSSAKLTYGECPEGVVKDFRTGPKPEWIWRPGAEIHFSDAERKARDEKAQKREAEKQAETDRVRDAAEKLYDKLPKAPGDHPYLKRKGIQTIAVDGLRDDLRQDGDAFVVPIFNATTGHFQAIQRIRADGGKLFDLNATIKGGCAHCGSSAGPRELKGGKEALGRPPIVICEGYATGMAIKQSVFGAMVLAAMCSGNLLAVATAIKRRAGWRPIVIAADIEEGGNGLKAAREAARAIDAKLAVPIVALPGKDFSDMMLASGEEAVKKAIDAADFVRPDPVEEETDEPRDDPEPGSPHVSDSNHLDRASMVRDALWPNLVRYREDFLNFDKGAYQPVSNDQISADVWKYLDGCRTRRKNMVVPYLPDRKRMGETLAALQAKSHISDNLEMPCWLNGRKAPSPSDLISFPNGLLNIETGHLLPPDPAFFTMAALGFDYRPEAPEPKAFLSFLDQIFENDEGNVEQDEIDRLQEMYGYYLTSDVSIEKAFLLWGPTRSGKGTILGVLRNLLASTAVAGPSLQSLSTHFGLQPLIGKQIAIIDDLRIKSNADTETLTENLLKITGRGFFTIDRKNKTAWNGTLPIKLLLVSNELPKLSDDSPALANRMVSIKTQKSFLGKEDRTLLEEKLLPELLGILHWSLAGLKRLRERGHFKETENSKEIRDSLANFGSPIAAFVADECMLGPDFEFDKKLLYENWCTYAQANNIDKPGSREDFFQSLYAATGHKVRLVKRGPRGQQVPRLVGIKLVGIE
jgi:P4 family phage/plasmid primase-like protien